MVLNAKLLVPISFRRYLKVGRARLFERFGSDRFSRPAFNALDTQMLAYLPKGPGVFLEIGANDGFRQSNTYYLERFRGWRGVLVEPMPKLFAQCQRIRPKSQCFNRACVATEATSSATMVDMDLMSLTLGQQDAAEEGRRLSGGHEITVKATTLSAILDEAGEPNIDFMSVDVEGAELSVLRGLDLDRHTPKFLLIETADPGAVEDLLRGYMTPIDKLSVHDYLFQQVSPIP